MKKQYIQPSAKAYTVKTAEILAGSLGDGKLGNKTVGGGDENSFSKGNDDCDW